MIDVHCHLFKEYYGNITEIIPADFEVIVNTADSVARFDECQEIAEKFKNVLFAVGIHPHNASAEMSMTEKLLEYIKHPKCAAVGEIGLDYYYDYSDRKSQLKVFEKQLDIAVAEKKNIVLHSRAAEADAYEIIKSIKDTNVLLHCYTGANEILEKFCANENIFFSIGGMITFKKNQQFLDYLNIIPINRLLIESDSPYLAPHPLRGKQNLPEYVSYTYQKIADALNIEFPLLEKHISENFIYFLLHCKKI